MRPGLGGSPPPPATPPAPGRPAAPLAPPTFPPPAPLVPPAPGRPAIPPAPATPPPPPMPAGPPPAPPTTIPPAPPGPRPPTPVPAPPPAPPGPRPPTPVPALPPAPGVPPIPLAPAMPLVPPGVGSISGTTSSSGDRPHPCTTTAARSETIQTREEPIDSIRHHQARRGKRTAPAPRPPTRPGAHGLRTSLPTSRAHPRASGAWQATRVGAARTSPAGIRSRRPQPSR